MKRIVEATRDIIWNRLELKRVAYALAALFRVIFRVFTYPVLWADELVERIRLYFRSRQRAPTQKQIRKRMVFTVISSILANRNSAIGSRAITRTKAWSIVLLEFVSFITTAIGMTIVASDISPVIAIIWALVIQGLAGSLSAFRGRWNNTLLAVCLVFSITSDYVCYVNAVFPYDQYIESSYSDYKASYDLAWTRALELTQAYESPDETVDLAFDEIETRLSLLRKTYNADKLETMRTALDEAKAVMDSTPPTVRERTGTTTTFNPETGQMVQTAEYSAPTPNPAYTAAVENYNRLYGDLNSAIETTDINMASIDAIEDAYSKLTVSGESGRARAKRLLSELGDPKREDIAEVMDEYAVLGGQIQLVIDRLNALTTGDEGKIKLYNLTEMRRGNEKYRELQALRLPDFSEIRESVNADNNSVFDRAFTSAAILIDSDFATNALDMKKKAEQLTNRYHQAFTESVSGLVGGDEELNGLIYGTPPDSGVLPLAAVYNKLEYKDALTKALEYLFNPGDKPIETYSRVVYACLADGLVLLIGFSLRKKRRSIFRTHNRRDLTNEEPRLMSEAFYNLAALPIPDKPDRSYSIESLLYHLNSFIGGFKPEPYLSDVNLNINFSMVCKDPETIDWLNKDYRELIGLLQTLKYIRPVSIEQYEFFRRYKLNKAALDSDKYEKALPRLTGTDDGYYYLMTEGFSLYFAEKLNDLHQHVESELFEKEIKKELSTKSAEDVI